MPLTVGDVGAADRLARRPQRIRTVRRRSRRVVADPLALRQRRDRRLAPNNRPLAHQPSSFVQLVGAAQREVLLSQRLGVGEADLQRDAVVALGRVVLCRRRLVALVVVEGEVDLDRRGSGWRDRPGGSR